jgi:N-acetylmuramoyl-L-alanine amidase
LRVRRDEAPPAPDDESESEYDYDRLVTARRAALVAALLAAVLLAAALDGQSPPPVPLRLVTAAGTRPLPTLVVNDVEYVALDELANVFPITVREDAATRAITVTWRGGRSIALTPDQSLASVSGKLVSLPTAPVKIGGKWFVPIDFLPRALAAVATGRLELRKSSRLVLAGEVRLPRVTVRHDVPGNEARVTFDISPPTPHSVVQEQNRLVVRFDADGLDASIAPFTTQGYVQSIRTLEGAAIAVELGPRFASFRASDVPVDARTARLVLDVFGSLETQAAPTPTPAQPPPAGSAEPPLLPAPAPGLRTIVLDPGHGGPDTGAKGAKGALEKDLALAIARRLKGAIESRLGARVLLTRDDDRALGADERAALANNNKADLFLSLHLASSVIQQNAGATIFVLDPAASAPDAATAAEPAVSMPIFGGGMREVDVLPWNRAQARHVDESSAFAEIVAARLQPVVPLHPRGIERAALRVLVGANMPALVVELGYLSNATDEARLVTPETQARMAQALGDAIASFDQRARERAAGGTR